MSPTIERPTTMHAAAMEAYGPPSVLTPTELPVPMLKPDQLLVRVKATTVNPADTKQRSGNLKLVLKHKFPVILGQDFSGVVEIAPASSKFKAGDEVYGSTAPRNGCSAEYVAVYEREAALKPKNLDWAEAAAAPTAVATAYRGIVSIGKATSGNAVLVHAASGGVGAAAAQLALACGCTVWGTCGASNCEYVRRLGVTPLDHSGAWEKELLPMSNDTSAAASTSSSASPKFDLIFDAVGGDDLLARSRPLLAPHGKYISAVGPVRHGGAAPITMGTILWSASVLVPRLLWSALWPWRKYCLYLSFDVADLRAADLAGYLASGRIRTRTDPHVFDLATLADAHAKCETNHSDGRIVVRVSE